MVDSRLTPQGKLRALPALHNRTAIRVAVSGLTVTGLLVSFPTLDGPHTAIVAGYEHESTGPEYDGRSNRFADVLRHRSYINRLTAAVLRSPVLGVPEGSIRSR
jgi:hypothetical protein